MRARGESATASWRARWRCALSSHLQLLHGERGGLRAGARGGGRVRSRGALALRIEQPEPLCLGLAFCLRHLLTHRHGVTIAEPARQQQRRRLRLRNGLATPFAQRRSKRHVQRVRHE